MKLFRKSQLRTAARRRTSIPAAGAGRATEADLETRYAFRRNRTLTGSLASGVESAKVQHMELRSERVQGHDLKSHRRRLGGVLLVVLACAGLLAYLVYTSIATPIITAHTPISVDRALYQQLTQQYLNAHPLQRFRFTLDTGALTGYLQSHGAPEVASIDSHTHFAGFASSTIVVTMRQPAVVWHTSSHTFFVDEFGNAFERNYYAEPAVQIVDESGIQTNGNQVLASNRFLGFIGKVIGQMKRQGYEVTKITLPKNTTRQVAVSVNQISYPIKFSIDRSAGEQAEDAARAMRYLTSKGAPVEYIDVRIGGKAYYR